MTHNRIAKVIRPVIFVGVATERVFGPVMEGVNVLPKPRDDVQRSVRPVHTKAHDVVIQQQAHESFLQSLLFHNLDTRIKPRYQVVNTEIQDKLRKHGQFIMHVQNLEFTHIPPHQIASLLQTMRLGWLRAQLWKREEHSLKVGIVHPSNGGSNDKEHGQFTQSHAALDVESCIAVYLKCDVWCGQQSEFEQRVEHGSSK
mmetsp:Transcript_22715/g.34055  ORF Transcript_22715/g.34055 Transcript_22715/m.34055 type:complete len:200 (-) Transcript_22715:1564-2163(-)